MITHTIFKGWGEKNQQAKCKTFFFRTWRQWILQLPPNKLVILPNWKSVVGFAYWSYCVIRDPAQSIFLPRFWFRRMLSKHCHIYKVYTFAYKWGFGGKLKGAKLVCWIGYYGSPNKDILKLYFTGLLSGFYLLFHSCYPPSTWSEK